MKSWEKGFLFVVLIISMFCFACGGGGGGNEDNNTTNTEEPKIDIGFMEPVDQAKVITDPASGMKVVNDQVLITFKDTVTEDSAKAKINALNGEIVGYLKGLNDYQVKINGNPTLDQLQALLDQLNADADVEAASLNTVNYETTKVPDDGNDPQWNELFGSLWDETDPAGNNWGLEAIYAPSAWDYNDDMEAVKIGIVDMGFHRDHEDINVPAGHTNSAYDDSDAHLLDPLDGSPLDTKKDHLHNNNHGTHVAGTIGARSNNDKGITGIVWKSNLYLFRQDSAFAVKFGTVWMLAKGVRVINYSICLWPKRDLKRKPSDDNTETDVKPYIEIPRRYYTAFMRKLIGRYDFLVVQAAGNEGIDAKWSGVWNSINDEDLRKRIITVGAINTKWDNNLPYHASFIPCTFSNYGSIVDIMAPGKDILSTTGTSSYEEMDGTSQATPHVTGVAAMVWAINPNFTAEQVKNIVVGAAETGDRHVDYHNRRYNILNAKNAVKMASEQSTQPIQPIPTGLLVGQVKDAIDQHGIENAIVRTTTKDGIAYYTSTESASDGSFELILDPGTYSILVFADGYIPITKNVTVTEGYKVYSPKLNAVGTQYSGNGDVGGYIINAFTGQGVSGLTINFRNGVDITSGNIAKTTTTMTNGQYVLTLPGGNYTGEIIGNGYITAYFLVVSVGGMSYGNQNGSITPIIPAGQTRIIMTWGASPSDLDSHLSGPLVGGTRFHLYYYYAETNYTSPWPDFVKLDLDDTSSYGPETTTIYQQIDGVYRFSVHDYSNRSSNSSFSLSSSGAQVNVYRGNSLVATYNVPTNQAGTLWTVFEMNGDILTPINNMSYTSDPSNINVFSMNRNVRTDASLMNSLPIKRR